MDEIPNGFETNAEKSGKIDKKYFFRENYFHTEAIEEFLFIMEIFYKLFDYLIPIVAGLLILVFAIIGYPKAKSIGTERKNIRI